MTPFSIPNNVVRRQSEPYPVSHPIYYYALLVMYCQHCPLSFHRIELNRAASVADIISLETWLLGDKLNN